MAKKLLLKIFSGPNLGAEAILADGEYTLGRGAQCDLVVDDHSVAEEHLRLKVAGEKVQAHPIGDARMLIAGKPTDGCTLPSGEYFTIGTTHLAIGFAGEQWILKPVPEIKLGDDAVPTPREPDLNETPVEAPLRKPRKRRILVFTTVAALIGVIGWGGWLALTPTVQASVAGPDHTGSALDELIAKHGVGETVKSEKTERGWIVKGHLQDRESLKALDAECRVHLPPSAIRLWDSETLAAASGEVLAAFRLAVAAAPGGPGEVIFHGRVPDAAQWARVRERIRHDVSALAALTDNVLTGTGKILRDSRGRAVDAATAPPPPPTAGGSYALTVPYPVKGGEDSTKDDAEPKPLAKPELKSAERSKTPNATDQASRPNVMYATGQPVPPTTTAANAAEKSKEPPVLAYQSVSVGASSWLRLADGTRVSVGGRIAGGYEVTSISHDAIEARKGESRIVYRLKEGT